eukprot:TRINITY_DN69975_c0_g1_i1.p1 TRINITY_DN69975_c0_g1~~TRINITY_DN69975_c0_g1_i1.p1  ORF type:complete len:209 (-),score=14.10 TRINITY_DN69975_c0_g1_i1:32-658(-)
MLPGLVAHGTPASLDIASRIRTSATHATWNYMGRLGQVALHVPLFVFFFASLVFWIQLLWRLWAWPCCEWGHPVMYVGLGVYAAYNCLVSAVFVVLTFACFTYGPAVDHSAEPLRLWLRDGVSARAMMQSMRIVAYDSATFGNGDDIRFPADCPICIQAFDSKGVIKVTRCGHAFHEACLATWLGKERSCPACRRDVMADGLLHDILS